MYITRMREFPTTENISERTSLSVRILQTGKTNQGLPLWRLKQYIRFRVQKNLRNLRVPSCRWTWTLSKIAPTTYRSLDGLSWGLQVLYATMWIIINTGHHVRSLVKFTLNRWINLWGAQVMGRISLVHITGTYCKLDSCVTVASSKEKC